jgi:spore coat protein A, manganese oxidase
MLWYHDHRMDFTAPAIWRGLAGLQIVRDDAEDSLGLPAPPARTPAHDHRPRVRRRRWPALPRPRPHRPAAGRARRLPRRRPRRRDPGQRRPVARARGRRGPVPAAHPERLQRRHYEFEAVTDAGRRLELVQIGATKGLLAAPVTHRSLPIAPAERYDLVIDFAEVPVGSRVRLVNRLGAGRARDVMAFRIARKASDPSRIPASSPPTCPPGAARTPPACATSPSAPDGWTAVTGG